MPTKRYAVVPGGPKQLEVRSKGRYRTVSMSFDGQPLLTEADSTVLRQGLSRSLPDGSTLDVQLVSSQLSGNRLRLLRNGQPVPLSDADPMKDVRGAAGALVFLAAVNGGLGLLALVTHVKALLELGLGVGAVILGLLFAGLAFGVFRRSQICLWAGFAIYAIDTVLTVVSAPSTGGLAMRIVIILLLVRGVAAMRQLKRAPAPGAGLAT